jgi:hydroxymethylbilane synthase
VQLAARRADLRFAELRGNMRTRLAKAAEFDAIVVAAVAFERLGLADRIDEVLDVEAMVPQVGQGALAVECRADDETTARALRAIEHGPSRRRVDTERAFLAELGGDCDLPAGAQATVTASGDLHLLAVLADQDGRLHRHTASGTEPERLGRTTAAFLRANLS